MNHNYNELEQYLMRKLDRELMRVIARYLRERRRYPNMHTLRAYYEGKIDGMLYSYASLELLMSEAYYIDVREIFRGD